MSLPFASAKFLGSTAASGRCFYAGLVLQLQILAAAHDSNSCCVDFSSCC